VRQDQTGEGVNSRRRAIFRVWPDFLVRRLTDRSVATVKGDAALRAYNASGAGIVWAVIDSGINASHPHFQTYETLAGEVAQLHRDFTRPVNEPAEALVKSALTDAYGHGTHVAGIIAGGLPPKLPGPRGRNLRTFRVGQHFMTAEAATPAEDIPGGEEVQERVVADQGTLTGVAPHCKLVSLKVLDENGESRSTDVIRALQYVRESVNASRRTPRIHGVNLSVGYGFNPKWFACGQSPICLEVDKLVRSGVVVVAAAGNTGFSQFTTSSGPTMVIGMAQTINDPGNADLAITVGSTHRDSPHTYGVSYFSSKGPTGDGRRKPDLVAPGERVTSCAAGKMLPRLRCLYNNPPPPDAAAYIDDSGTSMATPHVSGAIAAFLSIHREFIGRPERVKELFLANATSLGRDANFEGHGLVDLMRTIQAV
jgi:subtilisin family serine protease